MHGIDAEGLHDRQEHRRGNDDHRCHIHESAEQEQNDVDDQKHDNRIVRNRADCRDHQCLYLQERHQPAERRSRADDEQNHRCRTNRPHHRFHETAPVQLTIDKHGNKEGVENGNAGALRRGEDTRTNAAEDDADQQNAGKGRQKIIHQLRKAGKRLGRVTLAPRDDIGGDHQGRSKQQAWNDAGGE
ncbi:hypothetical protein D3C87_1341560 [compost metagenome]